MSQSSCNPLSQMTSRRGRLRLVGVLGTLAVTAATLGILRAGTALVVTVPVAAPDAIVSLASHEWERLPVTARLACRFPNTRVVLTLPPHVSRNNCHDCSHRVDALAGQGVARDRIVVLRVTQSSTYGEALAVRDYTRMAGLRNLLIVTSAYHTRRALATFSAVMDGHAAITGVMPADADTYARPSRWWARAYDRWYVTYEWSALIWYRLRHGVPIRIGEIGPGQEPGSVPIATRPTAPAGSQL